jgi:hypothetical protein
MEFAKKIAKTIKNRSRKGTIGETGIPKIFSLNNNNYNAYDPRSHSYGMMNDSCNKDSVKFLPSNLDDRIIMIHDYLQMYIRKSKKYIEPEKLIAGNNYYIEKTIQDPDKKQTTDDLRIYRGVYLGNPSVDDHGYTIYKFDGMEQVYPCYSDLPNRFDREVAIPPRFVLRGNASDSSYRIAYISDDSNLKYFLEQQGEVMKKKDEVLGELEEVAEQEKYNPDKSMFLGQETPDDLAEARRNFDANKKLIEEKVGISKTTGGRRKTKKNKGGEKRNNSSIQKSTKKTRGKIIETISIGEGKDAVRAYNNYNKPDKDKEIKNLVDNQIKLGPQIISMTVPPYRHAFLADISVNAIMVADWGGEKNHKYGIQQQQIKDFQPTEDYSDFRQYSNLLLQLSKKHGLPIAYYPIDKDLKKKAEKKVCDYAGGGCSDYIYDWTKKYFPDYNV